MVFLVLDYIEDIEATKKPSNIINDNWDMDWDAEFDSKFNSEF